jgi:hypothetical protein
MSSYDFPGLYQFLSQTPEQGLRKMLNDPKSFTETHFALLMKVVRGCTESEFAENAAKESFPKIRFSPAELKIKEIFWRDLVSATKARGLLSPASSAA